MPIKTRDLLARSWQSQANLSLFLLLLILISFVLPAVGLCFDPNKAPRDQWPFDLCNSPIFAGASDPQLFKKVSANDFAFVPGTYGSALS